MIISEFRKESTQVTFEGGFFEVSKHLLNKFQGVEKLIGSAFDHSFFEFFFEQTVPSDIVIG